MSREKSTLSRVSVEPTLVTEGIVYFCGYEMSGATLMEFAILSYSTLCFTTSSSSNEHYNNTQ
jgi:hypothetical protein